jgi:hypothetical protein
MDQSEEYILHQTGGLCPPAKVQVPQKMNSEKGAAKYLACRRRRPTMWLGLAVQSKVRLRLTLPMVLAGRDSQDGEQMPAAHKGAAARNLNGEKMEEEITE